MSGDIKYIGMDVHKEAVVIAVRNSTGQLVMESIVETKASSLLQFIHGLQGELHVTWEELRRSVGYRHPAISLSAQDDSLVVCQAIQTWMYCTLLQAVGREPSRVSQAACRY